MQSIASGHECLFDPVDLPRTWMNIRRRQREMRRRRRHRQLRMMTMGNMIGLAPVMLMVVLGLWWDVHCTGFFWSYEYEEESFRKTGGKVVRWVEDYQSEYGHLPDSIDAEWLAKSWDGDYYMNTYIDTTKWDNIAFTYRHWGDSAYIIVSDNQRMRFLSAPAFEGYLFYHWDEETDRMKVDTIQR